MTNSIVAHAVTAMSSKEIADLTGKQHKHVIRDVKALISQLYDVDVDGPNLDHYDFEGIFVTLDERKYVSDMRLDKDHTLTLLTGYDAKARMKVVRRWQELEAARQPALPQSYIEALKALVISEESKAALAAQARALVQQIETEKPYVDLARALTGSASCLTRRDWCALMKSEHGATFGERKLTQWLFNNRYIYHDSLDTSVPRAYANFAHLFKLEPERLNGADRLVLKVTGQGVRELTPKVLAALTAGVPA